MSIKFENLTNNKLSVFNDIVVSQFNKYAYVFNKIRKIFEQKFLLKVHLLGECYPDAEYLLISDPKGILIKSIKIFDPITIMLFNLEFEFNSIRTTFDVPTDYPFHNKNEIYISIVDTFKQFEDINEACDSYFYLTDIFPEQSIILLTPKNGCKDARKFFLEIWKSQLINSTIFCYNSRNELMVYVYNPYANYAPHYWNHVESWNQSTLFSKRYSIGKISFCFELS